MVLGGMKIPYGLSHKTLKRLCLTREAFSNFFCLRRKHFKSVACFLT
jgi:hypothetical protein